MSDDHLTSDVVGAFVDGELEKIEERAVLLHLEQCHACSLRILQTQHLKNLTKKAAAGRFHPSDEAMARMTAQFRPTAKRGNVIPFRIMFRITAWGALAAALLLAVTLSSWHFKRGSESFEAELLDQHLAALSSPSGPQVVSTDKHTVKPWFQGKLPFSFNLPEPTALPPDTALQGANLTYLENRATAMLLFTIRKHRVTVFVVPQQWGYSMGHRGFRAGFNFVEGTASGLEFVAVSDASSSDLGSLMTALLSAQQS